MTTRLFGLMNDSRHGLTASIGRAMSTQPFASGIGRHRHMVPEPLRLSRLGAMDRVKRLDGAVRYRGSATSR